MLRRLLATASAAAAMLSLSSCLDYEEDMIVKSDLSGQVLVTLTLPDTLISKYEKLGAELEQAKIEKRLDLASGVHLASYESTGGRQPKITMLIRFTSLQKLDEAIAANPPAAIWAGRFMVTKEGDLTKVERKLGMGDAGADLPEFNSAIYKTHFDGKITATNSGFYNQHGQDVRYRYKLAEMVAQHPVQSTTLAKSMPWMLILGCLVAVAGAAWYGWEQFGKKKPGTATTAPRTPAAPPAHGHPAAATPEAPAPAAPPPPAAPAAPRRPGPPQPRRPGAPPPA